MSLRARNGEKSSAVRNTAVGVDHRQRFVTVGKSPSVARDMLYHRQHAALLQSLGDGAPDEDGEVGRRPGGAVADDVMGARLRNVEDRRAVDGDTQGMKVGGDQPRVQPRRLDPALGIGKRQPPEGRRRRRSVPVGRLEAGDTATLLVDQHRGTGASDAVAE